ncbi:ornithine carbamoyltransferase [Solidesulfovibrio sp.]|uniref:ornithine carbamoyltransferase n=1 Tax=Solidesulfovibrio sp. TaxID=2910990 RepID=UPI002B200737|nr:ornithine carbamoyltransferase [Solidesulfovibrio sp.]MEA5087337.1 ornithine carbamoyltransferase [Solidesulfovibrio sp.]
MPQHFLTILDLSRDEAAALLDRAAAMKAAAYRSNLLDGKTCILVFEKASTRTRVSFEVAVRHLGGWPIFMTQNDSQLGRDEPIRDTARVLSRYADALIVRTFGHHKLEELAASGSVPVVNALSDEYHPCQIMADLLTMREHSGRLDGLTVAFVGDGNNIAHSLVNAAARFPIRVVVAAPKGYEPLPAVVERARSEGADVVVVNDPKEAARGAHYLYTDVWASMGQEGEREKRANAFAGFQINDALLAVAAPGAKVLHCLPAHRGEEITDAVMEGPASIVWDEAENRLHVQKAILEWIFTKG